MFADKLKNFTLNLPSFFENKKFLRIIIIIGCIGIALISASDLIQVGKTQKTGTTSEQIDLETYIETLENKAQKMLASISGAGKSKIMITAENSSKTEFATDDDISKDTKYSDQDVQEILDKKTEIVIIESSGDKTALVTMVKEPQIRGVLVLCEGADIPRVKENVMEAVKTVLGVPYNKICVIKLKT